MVRMPQPSWPRCVTHSSRGIGSRSCERRSAPVRGGAHVTLTARPPDTGPNGATSRTVHGFPLDEVLADLRTALVSRALDDRCIALTRQSRAYFQISSAGHEALLTATARSLRAGHDWFFPYYRDQPLVLALGVSAADVLLGSVGAATDPASSGRQLPCHWSDVERHIVTPSSPTGSQCL